MHGLKLLGLAACLVFAPLPAAGAAVVINEIFYNAPDDRDDLQWVELLNTDARAVDVSGWTLDEGRVYRFPAGTFVSPRGYLVVALDAKAFSKVYALPALGPLQRPLKRGSERLTLRDAAGQGVDVARYRDREPWPVSADGYSASLERICPTASGESAENWAASPLPRTVPRPAGTPGRPNVSYSPTLPPSIRILGTVPEELAPGQPLSFAAEVAGAAGVREVTFLYRVVTGGAEGREEALPMIRDGSSGHYQGYLPGQPAGRLLRYRIRAVDKSGARRFYPAPHDLRPTFSAYVGERREAARIPFGFLLRGGADRLRPGQPEAPEEPSAGRPASWWDDAGERPSGARGLPPSFDGPVGGVWFALFGPWGDSDEEEEMTPRRRAPRGASTFIYRDPTSGRSRVFDYIHAVSRARGPMYRGYKLFFNKDRPLAGMSAVNLVVEDSEAFMLAEPLAYDLYRRAGCPAPLTEFVRLWIDGGLKGYHLMVERPNRSFLRRNQKNDAGDLFKLLWYGGTLMEQHDRKTNEGAGHEALSTLIDRLHSTRGEERWTLIEKSFNVDQVATYFAVNMVLSHWDGFFNNYFVYHDSKGSGKWEVYPWDQDKTWGYYDGVAPGEVFFDMPLFFGMDGARPPAAPPGQDAPWMARFGGGPMWWRPPGHFSGPLLAQPRFRRVFLAETKRILERHYTPEIYFPLIDQMTDRLREDVILRARARGDDPELGKLTLAENVELMKKHVIKRRQFLLAQPELGAGDGELTAEARGPGRPR